jgi:hypothetical protein
MGALKDAVTVLPKGLCTAALHRPEAAAGVTAQCISSCAGAQQQGWEACASSFSDITGMYLQGIL